MAIHRCPVCNGCGTMPQGFYNGILGSLDSTTTVERETCRGCDGRGWVSDPAPLTVNVAVELEDVPLSCPLLPPDKEAVS